MSTYRRRGTFATEVNEETTHDNSSITSLEDILDGMDSVDWDKPYVFFSDSVVHIEQQVFNDAYHATGGQEWYSTAEIESGGFHIHPQDREDPTRPHVRALFRGKCLAMECDLTPTAGIEFGWPVVWTEDAAWIYPAHAINGS